MLILLNSPVRVPRWEMGVGQAGVREPGVVGIYESAVSQACGGLPKGLLPGGGDS